MKLKPLGPGPVPQFLSRVYSVIITVRNFWYDVVPQRVRKTGRFTISIGCIHAGGTGKTPLAILIGDYFKKLNHQIAFLSRGYKRQSKESIIVKPGEKKSWEEIGDEPAMFNHVFPDAWLGIGADRIHNAKRIVPNLHENAVVILDDAYQHRKIFRHKDIVCLPSDPFNDLLIPAGYLRESFSSLNRTHIICLIGLEHEKKTLEKNYRKIKELFPRTSIFIMYQSIDQWVNTKTGEMTQICPLKSPLVICGIARPHRFVEVIRKNGVTPYKCISYDDHHVFTKNEIEKLYNQKIDGILTTEKDNMRLSTINLVNCPNICYLKIKLTFSDKNSERIFFSKLSGK